MVYVGIRICYAYARVPRALVKRAPRFCSAARPASSDGERYDREREE